MLAEVLAVGPDLSEVTNLSGSIGACDPSKFSFREWTRQRVLAGDESLGLVARPLHRTLIYGADKPLAIHFIGLAQHKFMFVFN